MCRDRLVGGAEEQEQEEFGKVSDGAAAEVLEGGK